MVRLRCGVWAWAVGKPPTNPTFKDIQMNTFSVSETIAPEYSHAFGRTLSIDELRHQTPAVFASNASARTKPTYRFINTAHVRE